MEALKAQQQDLLESNMSIRDSLKVISEADGSFENMATPEIRNAVSIAEKSSGVVSVGPDWERTATTEQREARRVKSLSSEKKQDPELYKNLDGEIRAKYKIEVTFGEGRTSNGPNLVGIQVWESGKRLNGGGDDLAFWCRSTESEEGCWGLITSNNVRGGIAYCGNCQRAVNADLLTNMKIGRVITKNLSADLEKLFRYLDSNADLYLKFHKTDIRYIAMERAKGHEAARRLKGMHIYPLKNILKDISNGASLLGRFQAFLTS